MGSSYSAYFTRRDRLEDARRVFGAAEIVADSPWLTCGYRRGASPPSDDVLWGRASLTEAKSREVGEVLFIYADTSTDAFVYEHARDGALVRKLVWFPALDDDWTPGWLCAEGEREAWEDRLFLPDRLPRLIDEERDLYEERGDGERFPEREAEIQRVWKDRPIVAMSTIPRCDGTVGRLVEEHFGLAYPQKT